MYRLLGVVYRTMALDLGCAGLSPVGVACPGVEDVDASDLITTHMDYREHLTELLDLLVLEERVGGHC